MSVLFFRSVTASRIGWQRTGQKRDQTLWHWCSPKETDRTQIESDHWPMRFLSVFELSKKIDFRDRANYAETRVTGNSTHKFCQYICDASHFSVCVFTKHFIARPFIGYEAEEWWAILSSCFNYHLSFDFWHSQLVIKSGWDAQVWHCSKFDPNLH